MSRINYLHEAIVEYVKKTDRPDSIDIVTHFKNLRVDITYKAIKDLEAQGKITRHNHFAEGWNGNHHYE